MTRVRHLSFKLVKREKVTRFFLHVPVFPHPRSLKSLGIPSSSYGSLLSSIIVNKLPQELQLIISREIKDQDWPLDNIMHALENELKARERAVSHEECQSSGGIQRFSEAQMRTTTSALFAGHSGPTCTYCSLVSGSVVRGEPSVTAIETKLGWVLSGPIPEGTQVNRQQSNLVTTHVLKSAVKPVDVTNETLDGTLKTFWELESLGIKPRTLYEEFQEQISFTNERYEVHLPWKTPHPLLPDNYQLSRKRLENLLERLRHEPEVLREYDSVIKEQLHRGIVEVVETSSKGEVGRVHYIRHHAVIRRDKLTTKLRVFYDASTKSDGVALND